jgi:mono/diheme cytochrome c family protein
MLVGCGSGEAYFTLNQAEVHARDMSDEAISGTHSTEAADASVERQRIADEIEAATAARQEVADILLALFGTPDEPDAFLKTNDPDSLMAKFGFDTGKLRLAAGPVYSDDQGRQHGLYRLHCAHCHGVTGDGQGPTGVFLNPYPRDYRQGAFKFKSTWGNSKPTHGDLKRVLMEGIPGTAMPSFKLLPDNELDALIEYVKYLSVRGQTEILLIGYEGELPDGGINQIAGALPLALDDEGLPAEEPDEDSVIASMMHSWAVAPQMVIHPVAPQVPMWPTADRDSLEENTALQESIDRGRLQYVKSECNSCHGPTGLGDGDIGQYDEWTKAIYDPKDKVIDQDRLTHMLLIGEHPPRPIRPRNLRQGAFRGGRRPMDLYRRIFTGVNGTPMVKQGTVGGIAGDEVSDEDAGGPIPRQRIWDLVNYVMSLQYEPLSKGPAAIEGKLDKLQ